MGSCLMRLIVNFDVKKVMEESKFCLNQKYRDHGHEDGIRSMEYLSPGFWDAALN